MTATLLDLFFPREVTRDQLAKLGGNARFRPPPPPVPAGHVFYGVAVTKEDWANYERPASPDADA
jgi:hypothetical protein